MAEIPVERKPRRSMTPLLLILLLIILIAAGWYWWTNKNAAAGTTTSSITPIARVASFTVPTNHSLHFRRV
jgi:TRAP-type C4-dicarboxylate transport system permease small subunit